MAIVVLNAMPSTIPGCDGFFYATGQRRMAAKETGMLAWEQGYKIGQWEMDAEHLILFSLLNQLDININADLAQECVHDVLAALGAYIDYHFAHEEALMKAWGYPRLEEHSARHHDFMNEVARLRAQVQGDGTLKAALKVRAFVLDWLLGHILDVDADYAQFIAAKAQGQDAP